MKYLLATICLTLTAAAANAEMIEAAVIVNNTHAGEYMGAHTSDVFKTRCSVFWDPIDYFIYDTAQFWCYLLIGPLGPNPPTTEIYARYREDPAPYTQLNNVAQVYYEETTSITEGCGDKKWQLKTDWEEIREPDNRPPDLEEGIAQVTKVITWVQ